MRHSAKLYIWRHRLQTQIGVILLSLTTLTLAGTGVYQYFQLRASQMQAINHLAEFSAERLADVLISPLWNLENEIIDGALISEMKEPVISAILVKNPEGKIIAMKGRDRDWKVVTVDVEPRAGEFAFEQFKKISKLNEELGMVEVYVTDRFVHEELRGQILSMVALIVMLDLLLLIGLSLTIRVLLTRPLGLLLQAAQAIGNGDLTQTIHIRQQNEIGQFAKAFAQMMQQVKTVIGEAGQAANTVASGSEQMSLSAAQMSQGASTQAAAAEEASSSMEEMTANIRQSAENAAETERIAKLSAQRAEQTGQAVAEAVAAMQQIAKKVAIIQDITRQTRMLSLNATIEAARAQDYGKGFAVVAAEVRALAERSQNAASEITELVHTGVTTAEHAGKMLSELVPNIQKTAGLVQEIAASAKEQDMGTSQINNAIQQLDQVIQQNAASLEQIASTTESLAAHAEQLRTRIHFFQLGEMPPSEAEQKRQTAQQAASSDAPKSPSLSDVPIPKPRPAESLPSILSDDDFERF